MSSKTFEQRLEDLYLDFSGGQEDAVQLSDILADLGTLWNGWLRVSMLMVHLCSLVVLRVSVPMCQESWILSQTSISYLHRTIVRRVMHSEQLQTGTCCRWWTFQTV